MKLPKLKTTVYSAGRVDYNQPTPYVQAQLNQLRQAIKNILEPLMPWLSSEPWLFTDDQKMLDAERLADFFVSCKTEFFYSQTLEGEPVGVQALMHYRPWKWCYYLAWCSPKYRSTKYALVAAKDCLTFAFEPPPTGLGLLKLRAEVSPENRPALAACRVLGFRPLVVIPWEAFYNQVPCSIVLLDLYNKACLPVVEEIIHDEPNTEPELRGEQLFEREPTIGGGPGGAGVHESVERELSLDNPGSVEREPDNGAGNGGRADVGPVTKSSRKPRSRSKRRATRKV